MHIQVDVHLTRTDNILHCHQSFYSRMATSALVEAAKKKTEAYLPAIDAQRSKTVSSTDLEGAVPYEKKYVGKCDC